MVRPAAGDQGRSDRTEAEKTIAVVAPNIEDKTRQAAAALARRVPNVKDNAQSRVVLRVLGRIGDSSALPTLRTALGNREPEIPGRRASRFGPIGLPPTGAHLLKVAQTAENARYNVPRAFADSTGSWGWKAAVPQRRPIDPVQEGDGSG